jgi:hypothetical protein
MKHLTPSHGAMPPPGAGLARYGSAPGSLVAAIAESVTRESAAPPPPVSRFFSAESSGLASCESIGQPPLQRAYGGSGEIRVPPPPAQQMGLLRHSSSPAGLLSRIMADMHGTSSSFSSLSSPLRARCRPRACPRLFSRFRPHVTIVAHTSLPNCSLHLCGTSFRT